MFKELRRKDRKMGDLETIEILEKGNYGVLSTLDKNGYPYGVPLSYVYINNSIYFHSAVEGNKIDNIINNNKISFCVVGEHKSIPEKFTVKYKSVILFGNTTEVDGDEKKEALLGLIKKYSQKYIEEGKKYIDRDIQKTKVLKINIEHLCGKVRD